MDTEMNAMPTRGRGCIHSCSSIRSHRLFQMLIAPVVYVVREKVGTNSELGHAPKVRLFRHLAMLQGMTMIRSWKDGQGRFDCVDGNFRRFVSVRVDVKMHAFPMIGFDH